MNWLLAFVSASVFLFVSVRSLKKGKLFEVQNLYAILASFLLFFALVLENGHYGYSGYCWILASIVVVQCGAKLGSRIAIVPRRRGALFFRKDIVGAIVLFGSFVLIAVALSNYVSNGGVSSASQNAYDYYTGETVAMTFFDNVINQLLSVSFMIICFLGGIYFVLERKPRRFFSAIVFAYPVINMLYSTLKLGLILAIMYFFIGVLACYSYLGKPFFFRDLVKVIKRYWVFGVGVIALFLVSFMLRFGRFDSETFGDSLRKICVYAFGGYQCFNAWLSSFVFEGYRMGLETFMGLPHALGLVDRPVGLYENMLFVGIGRTNIYTAFRPLITDFGIVGSLVALFFAGFLSKIALKSFKRSKNAFSFFILCVSYLYFLYSPITSPFIYLNVSASFLMLVFLVEVGSRLFYRGQRKTFVVYARGYMERNRLIDAITICFWVKRGNTSSRALVYSPQQSQDASIGF